MTQTKKLVHGTQRGLDKQIELHNAKGWVLQSTETVPRGNTGRLTYIAYLKR